MMSLRASGLLSAGASLDAATLGRASAQAAQQWREAELIPSLTLAIQRDRSDAKLWQLLAVAQRALGNHVEAIQSIGMAAKLAPSDALIAHAHARVAFEAGLSSVPLFEHAWRLAPLAAPVMLGRAAALHSVGQTAIAVRDLTDTLRRHPAWYEGHAALARLRWQAGDRADYTSSFDEALVERPRDGILWREYAHVVLRAGEYERVLKLAGDARTMLGSSRTLDLVEAAAYSESGQLREGDRLFGLHAPLDEIGHLTLYVRHLLRSGRPAEAAAAVEGRLSEQGASDLWPLAAVAWRLCGDPRWQWLEQDGAFIQSFDLADQVGPLEELAAALRALHVAKAPPFDQSLRGGTQTDGPLFSRLDPPIQKLRAAVEGAVRRYIDALPPRDGVHPLLSPRRDTLRFAGSWSVRLEEEGHHVDHVHSAGWISSAFYVAVPSGCSNDNEREGWLSLGDAPSLGVDITSLRSIQPRPGLLVLFPSTMWHRTRPFMAGERLTVAFDVARPPG